MGNLGISSFSASYKYSPSRVLLITLLPISDLQHKHPALPPKVFCAPFSTIWPRFHGICRESAVTLKNLGHCQISLQMRPSEDLRSTFYTSDTITDCSLQSRLSFPPRSPGEVCISLLIASYYSSWHHLFSLKKILLEYLAL